MAHGIAALSSERHYMGSFTSGSYATDRNVRPDYDMRPTFATRMRWAANEKANQTRYLRKFDALGCVIDCHEAKEELAAVEARLCQAQEGLVAAEARIAQASPSDSTSARDIEQAQQLRQSIEALTARREQALDTRRHLSSQLRLMGISPKDEAEIWRAFQHQETAAER